MMPTRAPRPSIRLAPVAFGYGPVGKALHVARAIRDRVGDEVHIELVAGETFAAAREPGLFDAEHASADVCPEVADATVTFMNTAGVRAYVARGEFVHVVDSLAWLWDEPLPVSGAHRYYYQDLPILPVPRRNLQGQPRPTAIGAIGALSTRPGPPCRTGGPVLTLSGLQSPASNIGGGAVQYVQYVTEAVEQLLGADLHSRGLTIHGNRSVLDRAVSVPMRAMIGGGTQAEFARAALRADRVIASPGLTTLVECLRSGVAIGLLPPQNYSQVKILAAFVQAGLTGHGWPSAVSEWLTTAVLPERLGAEIVCGVIARARAEHHRMPTEQLAQLLDDPIDPMAPEMVTGMLGTGDGAAEVADRVLTDVIR